MIIKYLTGGFSHIFSRALNVKPKIIRKTRRTEGKIQYVEVKGGVIITKQKRIEALMISAMPIFTILLKNIFDIKYILFTPKTEK